MNPYMGPKELPVDPVTVTAIQALARTQRGLHSENRSIVQEQINLKKKEYQIAKIWWPYDTGFNFD